MQFRCSLGPLHTMDSLHKHFRLPSCELVEARMILHVCISPPLLLIHLPPFPPFTSLPIHLPPYPPPSLFPPYSPPSLSTSLPIYLPPYSPPSLFPPSLFTSLPIHLPPYSPLSLFTSLPIHLPPYSSPSLYTSLPIHLPPYSLPTHLHPYSPPFLFISLPFPSPFRAWNLEMTTPKQSDSALSSRSSTDLQTSPTVSSNTSTFQPVNRVYTASECRHITIFMSLLLCKFIVFPCMIFDPALFISDDHNHIVLAPIQGHADWESEFVNGCYVDVSPGATVVYSGTSE